MNQEEYMAAIEAMLFVAGDPVPILELQRVTQLTALELRSILSHMEEHYQQRGIVLLTTQDTAQLVSNPAYAKQVQDLLQPIQSRPFSQTMLETLAVVAYKQPITRAEIESIRGVRCEYTIQQLQKLDMITAIGRKDVVGRPLLFGTTDAFLRKFGLHSIHDLPDYGNGLRLSEDDSLLA